MIYDSLNLDTGDLLNKEVFEHIDQSFDKLYTDLYDIKTDNEWTLVGQTCDISNPDYTNEYPSSTFSGWCGCIGKPSNFNKIKFPIKPRTDYTITSITVQILEIPAFSDVVLGSSASNPYNPTPSNWTVVASKILNFGEDNALVVNNYNYIECEFDEIINNSEGKYYYLSVCCNNRVTMGFFKTIYDDIEFNPWIWYATGGRSYTHTGLGVGTYDSTSTEVYTLACEFYYKSSSTSYITIGTEKKDKFFNLVNECINNSDSFGEIFQEAYKYNHLCGSINLSDSTASYYQNTTSTFTGVIFPIGVIPNDLESAGALIQVKARSFNNSTAPISKVNVFLYSVEDIPLTETYKGQQFNVLNPTLLRSGVATCNIAVGEEGVVFAQWTEGTFVNTENKFLMLGYECDTFNYRCTISGKSGASVCGSIDGNTYGSLETWYSTSTAGEQSWRPRWQDSQVNAWSLVAAEKYYDLGEKFYILLDKALDEALADTSVDVNIAPTSEVRLANQYDLVVGDKFQLFYEGVIKGFDVLNEGILVNCSVGKQYPRYWEFEPTNDNAGKSYTLTIKTRQLDGSVISTGSTTIKVHAKLTNETTPSNLTALIFGDSLTSSATWAAEGFRRIYGTDESILPMSHGVTNTITTYGSKNNTHNGFKIYHEGYGGWTWNSFLTAERGSDSTTNGIVVTLESAHGYDLDTVQKSIWTDNNGLLWELEDFPSETQIKFNRGDDNNAAQSATTSPTTMTCTSLSLTITLTSVVWETTNPFYDEATESLNFNAHAATYGAGDADIVACLLTWNGGGGTADFNQEAKISVHMNKATQLLKAIHEDLPNAKIICMGIQLSSITGGAGYNYGAKGGYADTWSTAFYAFDYDKALEELLTTDPELAEYCYYCDTKGQFDTRYCMPYANVAVNTRVSGVTEMRGTNGVHPSTNGYYQIGDAFYRILHRVIPTINIT